MHKRGLNWFSDAIGASRRGRPSAAHGKLAAWRQMSVAHVPLGAVSQCFQRDQSTRGSLRMVRKDAFGAAPSDTHTSCRRCVRTRCALHVQPRA